MFTDRFRARAANVVFRRAIPNFCECFLLVCFCPARLLDTQKRALEINPYVITWLPHGARARARAAGSCLPPRGKTARWNVLRSGSLVGTRYPPIMLAC